MATAFLFMHAKHRQELVVLPLLLETIFFI